MLTTDKRKKNNGMIEYDRAIFLSKCGRVWKRYVAELPVLVVTEHKINPQDLFEEYFNVILIGVKKGLVTFKTLSEVTLEDLNEPEQIIEF